MELTRRSPISGVVNTLSVNISEEEYTRWMAGELAQNVFRNLNEDEREFVMTGIYPGEWDALFGEEE